MTIVKTIIAVAILLALFSCLIVLHINKAIDDGLSPMIGVVTFASCIMIAVAICWAVHHLITEYVR